MFRNKMEPQIILCVNGLFEQGKMVDGRVQMQCGLSEIQYLRALQEPGTTKHGLNDPGVTKIQLRNGAYAYVGMSQEELTEIFKAAKPGQVIDMKISSLFGLLNVEMCALNERAYERARTFSEQFERLCETWRSGKQPVARLRAKGPAGLRK